MSANGFEQPLLKGLLLGVSHIGGIGLAARAATLYHRTDFVNSLLAIH